MEDDHSRRHGVLGLLSDGEVQLAEYGSDYRYPGSLRADEEYEADESGRWRGEASACAWCYGCGSLEDG